MRSYSSKVSSTLKPKTPAKPKANYGGRPVNALKKPAGTSRAKMPK